MKRATGAPSTVFAAMEVIVAKASDSGIITVHGTMEEKLGTNNIILPISTWLRLFEALFKPTVRLFPNHNQELQVETPITTAAMIKLNIKNRIESYASAMTVSYRPLSNVQIISEAIISFHLLFYNAVSAFRLDSSDYYQAAPNVQLS